MSLRSFCTPGRTEPLHFLRAEGSFWSLALPRPPAGASRGFDESARASQVTLWTEPWAVVMVAVPQAGLPS